MSFCPFCGSPVEPDGVIIDAQGGIVTRLGKTIRLTKIEGALFAALYRHRSETLTMDRLVSSAWPDPVNEPEASEQAVRVHVYRLRQKIKPLHIEIRTEWHRGYMLVDTVPAAQRHDQWVERVLREAK